MSEALDAQYTQPAVEILRNTSPELPIYLGGIASPSSVEVSLVTDVGPNPAYLGVRTKANGELDWSAAAKITIKPKNGMAQTESPNFTDRQPQGPFTGVRRLPNGELDWSAAASVSILRKSKKESPPKDIGIDSEKQTARAKSSELLQAQVASFARKNDYRAGLSLFQEMGNLVDAPDDLTYTDFSNPDITHTISKQDYIDHLRQIGGAKDEGVQVRKESLEAYKSFAPNVIDWLRTIRAERQDVEFGAHNNHPAFVGEGAYNAVFAFNHEGKEYVAKFNDNAEGAGRDVDDVALDLAAGKGIAHLEQIVAISYEDGVAICERMTGKDFSKLSIEDLEQIPEEHLAQALHTMREAAEKGIILDGKNESNYFYDKSDGFGFIDYSNIKHSNLIEGTKVQSDSDMATEFIENLVIVNRNGIAPEVSHEQSPREISGRIVLLQKFRAACERSMQTENTNYADTIRRIDEITKEFRQSLEA